MKALVLAATIAMAGDWVSTPDGRRVCQLSDTLVHGMVLQSGFCMNWQAPFLRPLRGQLYPVGQGWIRTDGGVPGSRWGTLQLHIEGKGWVP